MRNRALRFACALAWLAAGVAGVFVVNGALNAVRDSVGFNRLIVPLSVQPGSTAQLFLDRGAGIRAEDCSNAWASSGAVREVVFQVPRVPLLRLRLDPIQGSGTFLVGAPRLESPTGRLVAQFPITAVVPLHQIAEMRLQGDHWAGRTDVAANDPQLNLGLGAPLRVGQLRLPWTATGVLVVLGLSVVGLSTHSANRQLVARFFGNVQMRLGTMVRAIHRGDGWAIVSFGVLVAGVQWAELWPLHRSLDWPLWDEINYAARGATWAKQGGDLGALHSSPLYVASYGLLAYLAELPAAIFAQHYFVKVASTVLLYIVLARWWRSVVAAAAVALYWGSTAFQLEFPLLVYQSAWIWYLAGIAVFARWPIAGLALIAVAMGMRQEYQFALVAGAAWLVWWLWKRRGSWETGKRRLAFAFALLVAVVVAVMLNSSSGSGAGRAWFAFQQHYAVRAVQEGDKAITNPWLEYTTLIERDFPGARSLSNAWRTNPRALLRHVGFNLRNLGAELIHLGRVHERRPTALWYLVVACAALTLWPRYRTDAHGDSRPSRTLVAASAGAFVIAPGMLVLAKAAYLLPVVPLIFGVLGAGLQRIGEIIKVRSKILGWLTAALFALLLFWGAVSPRVFIAGDRPRPQAETAMLLRDAWPSFGRHRLLGVSASSFAHYIGDERSDGVEPVSAVRGQAGAATSLDVLVDQVNPLAVLVTHEWRAMSEFDAEELAAALPDSEWKRQTVPIGDVYWREARDRREP